MRTMTGTRKSRRRISFCEGLFAGWVMRRKWDKAVALAVLAVTVGLVFGAFRPRFFSEADLAELVAALRLFAADFDSSTLGAGALAESLLRYGRALGLIWVCAALPKAYYAAFLVIYMRAMVLGFSAALMVEAFGGRGLLLALGLYGIQNVIIMPVYAYTTCYIAKNPARMTPKAVKIAGFGVVGVVVVSAVEVYIAPGLFEILLRGVL